MNIFLQICSVSIIKYGGELSKFIGDCVLASFPVEKVNEALEACVEIQRSLVILRKNAGVLQPCSVLYCGTGELRIKIFETQ